MAGNRRFNCGWDSLYSHNDFEILMINKVYAENLRIKHNTKMKDLEKLKEHSLQELNRILIESEAEIVKHDIGYSRTVELTSDIKKIRRLINLREGILE